MLADSTLELHHRVAALAEGMRPLPTSIANLASAIGTDDVDADAVAAILREDPALVAAVLKEANSASSAARDGIGTVEAAIVRLGFARVLAVAVARSIEDDLDTALPSYGVAAGVLRRHAVAASHAAEIVRSMASVAIGPEIVTAALLHDLGTVLLGAIADRPVLDAARAHRHDLADAERELFDVDHAELGGMLADLWRLPAVVAEAIRWHHHPERGGDDPGTAPGQGCDGARAVALADDVAHELLGAALGWREETDVAVISDALAHLGIDRGALVERVARRLDTLGLLDEQP